MRSKTYVKMVTNLTSRKINNESAEVAQVASAVINSDNVITHDSLKDYFKYLKGICNGGNNVLVYIHDLKIGGAFILDYLLKNKCKQAYYKSLNGKYHGYNSVSSGTVSYNISDMGQWYNITYRYRKQVIEFRDSAKLLPFKVSELEDAFKTKYKRDLGNNLINNLMIVKECLEQMLSEGYDGLTIGSCCMREWKILSGFANKDMYRAKYPDLTNRFTQFGETVDSFIRKSYKGGWCYVNPEYEGKILDMPGLTVDANSMYSSVMHSSSGHRYCYGEPHIFIGLPPMDVVNDDNKYFFIRFRCSFNIKPGMLPTVQIKGDQRYKGNEWLTTSDICVNGLRIKFEPSSQNELKPITVELTMTETDFNFFLKHYDVDNFKCLGGVYFDTTIGIFDSYIDKYMEKKMHSKGAKRTIAKLFLNNLYGKFSTSSKAGNYVCELKDDIIDFETMEGEKESGYIAIGAQVTSYARARIIEYAQQNIDRFMYSDTDSLHMIGEELPNGIPLHESKLGYWKIETRWDKAVFLRQKTYIEHIVYEDDVTDYYNVKCCGMTEKIKKLVSLALSQNIDQARDLHYNEDEIEYVKNGLDFADFTSGFTVTGNEKSKRVKGGVIYEQTTFKIR